MPLSPDEVAFLQSKGVSPQAIAAYGSPKPTPETSPAPSNASQPSPKALAPDEVAFLRSKGVSPEAIASYGAAPAPQPQMGQNAPQTAQGGTESGFFAPGQAVDRAVEGAKQVIPFLQAGENLVSGKPAYENSPEGWGRAAGDIGGAAATVASGGIKPLAQVAGLSAALNALGIPQGAQRIGEAIEKPAESIQNPSKMFGIEGLGTAMNFLGRVPTATAATGIEALPYFLAGKAAGIAEPAAARAGAPEAAPAAPVPLTPESLLQEHGGELTPAMRAKGGVPKAVATGIEKLAAVNPITSALPEGIQAKNVGAVQSYLEKTLGPDVAGLSMADYAPKLAEALSEYKGERSGRFGAAETALSGLESKLPKPVGEMASDRIIRMLEGAGVPSDENGFNPALMTGNERIDPTTAKALVAMERQVRNAKTIPDLLAQRQNIDRSGIMNFEAPPDAMGRLKGIARGLVNNTLTEAVESSGDPAAIDAWKKANAEYSQTAPVMKKLGKAGANALLGPEALTKILTDKAQGGRALDTLKANMTPEQWGSVQDAAVNAILDKSRGKGGAISADALSTNLGKNMAHVVSRLDPEKQAALQNAQAMMEKAQIADLRRDNPPGSGTAAVRNAHLLGGLLAPHALLGETLGLGGYYGASKALPVVSDALSTIRERAAQAVRSPIPGTAPIPPQLLDMLRKAVSRPGAQAARAASI